MPQVSRVTVEATVTVVKARAVFSYRLINWGDAALGEFALVVPTGAALRSPSSPPGWLVRYSQADGRLVWQSSAPPTDLAPGRTLSGFRFRASAPAGPATYRVRHFAPDGRTASRGSGTTQAPIARPVRPWETP